MSLAWLCGRAFFILEILLPQKWFAFRQIFCGFFICPIEEGWNFKLEKENMDMVDVEKILEFDQIKKKLAEYACTKKGKEECLQLKPYMAEREVLARLRETTEAKRMITLCGNPPTTALKGIEEWILIAEKGGCLTPEQLEEVTVVLTAVRRIKDYLKRCEAYEIGIAYYGENLDSLDEIYHSICEKIRNNRVDDFASKRLKSIREEMERTKEKMSEKAESIIRANKECMSDCFSTLRNGHLCIPVKKEYKYKISGSVIEKSATGNTVFIEPASVGKLYREWQELQLEEENEERQILYTLTSLLSDKAAVIAQNSQTIEKLDFLFAKAKFSIELDGIEPSIHTRRWIRIQEGYHPLMKREETVPLDFEIGNGINGVVITGPNTGGKTVAIKTVALTCFMAQSGLHVSCRQAEICMNNQILCDIGDGQNLAENLSTFSAHITNVMDILRRMSQESLIVLDELGSGTDPAEGMGIAVAILEELKQSGALFLVTTHYPEVKEYAEKEKEIVNARMTFDRESLRPLYKMVIGEAGESCAFFIAARLGMTKEMLQRAAYAAYGKFADEKLKGIEIEEKRKKETSIRIQKNRANKGQKKALEFQLGDSVLVLPDQKIGIVCQTANEKGVLQVQMQKKKIWINYKRVRLHVAASELYPENYDFSVIFDSVEKRKALHRMNRKYVESEYQYKEF